MWVVLLCQSIEESFGRELVGHQLSSCSHVCVMACHDDSSALDLEAGGTCGVGVLTKAPRASIYGTPWFVEIQSCAETHFPGTPGYSLDYTNSYNSI